MPEKQYFTGIDIINAPRIESLTVTEDGTYTASSDVIGYNPVVVNTNQPWTPLQDGYSNFWFELTNDTLSPWLNFSAKNNDATIDWGDGSGEVALDTLTPTHTYSKAGKYVVKVKGVTGIARQLDEPLNDYAYSLMAIELNSEVTNVSQSGFTYATRLAYADLSASSLQIIDSSVFFFCANLVSIKFPTTLRYIYGSAFRFNTSLKEMNTEDTSIISFGTSSIQYCNNLKEITIPSSCTSVGTSVLSSCVSLETIHIQTDTPPALGTAALSGLPTNFIIYVPVGTGETYKAAEGWSTYADHILEEGQTPNRAMLSKMTVKDDADTDEEMR